MTEEVKKTLQKQLELLSKRSEDKVDLPGLTHAMVAVAELLERAESRP